MSSQAVDRLILAVFVALVILFFSAVYAAHNPLDRPAGGLEALRERVAELEARVEILERCVGHETEILSSSVWGEQETCFFGIRVVEGGPDELEGK